MATPRSLASSPFNNLRLPPPPPVLFEVGQRVTHDRHGLGRVVGVEGEIATLVDFGDRVVRVAVGSGRLHAL
ncbi:hypothetical protein [Occultella gossypii]|uniref:ATP-binding protein n=1 Tax=Occultella gossypii TaxID=2800820 RepID=A0ABS7S9R1_9MICO|nr:hypothetical protein [Occultella gossypii]MBZ2196940.1 hypothetical protein [Occultella gossypii]